MPAVQKDLYNNFYDQTIFEERLLWTSHTLRTATSIPPRSVRIRESKNGSKRIEIVNGKVSKEYLVRPMASDFGRAFSLLRISEDPEVYHVLLHGPESSCTCAGGCYRGHCKHVGALQALANSGKL